MDLVNIYHHINTELADKRSSKWPLISSPMNITLISCIYLYLVLYVGPKYMKDRKPYKLHTFIRFYNLFQIVANALIVYHIFDAGWYREVPTSCFEPIYTYEYKSLKLAKIAWYTFSLKLIDFIETAVFVLRKKQRQVSNLHLYHHISTVYLSWSVVKYLPNHVAMTYFIVNSSVHVMMYTYYLLASFGPKIQRILQPVKPAITITQMVQFVILLAYTYNFLSCSNPLLVGVGYFATSIVTMNFILFYNFYRQNYIKKTAKDK